MSNPTLFVMIGLPGSGKSTVAKKLAKQKDAEVVCPDDIREEMTGDPSDQSCNSAVWEEVYVRIGMAIQAGRNVILDATAVRARDRETAVISAGMYGADVCGVYVRTPVNVCKKRNARRERVVPDHVIDRMARLLRDEPPTDDEFDMLLVLDVETPERLSLIQG